MGIHFIIYSHGFGVDETDRGLMADISAALPGFEHILFDYNQIDSVKNEMTISPLQDQAAKLKIQLEQLPINATIDLIAHSQGCLVAALVRPKHVRKIVFLAPPDNVDVGRLKQFFGDRPGSFLDENGISRVPRRDGSTTIIYPNYWASLKGLQPIRSYNQLAENSEVTFFVADNDEVLGFSQFEGIDPRIKLVEVAGNHDFNGKYRPEIIRLVREIIAAE